MTLRDNPNKIFWKNDQIILCILIKNDRNKQKLLQIKTKPMKKYEKKERCILIWHHGQNHKLPFSFHETPSSEDLDQTPDERNAHGVPEYKIGRNFNENFNENFNVIGIDPTYLKGAMTL